MERQVKERLVGAAVLMAAAVILIPEMLSGPDREDAASKTTDASNASARGSDTAGKSNAPIKTYTIDLSQSPGTSSVAAVEDTSAPPPDEDPPTAETPPQSSATEAQAEPEPTDESVDTPAAVAATPVPEETPQRESAPEPVVEAPTRTTLPPAEPAPRPVASAQTAPTSGGWAVQLGSFSKQPTAEKLMKEMRAQGHSAFVMPVKSGSATLYRVRIGPTKDRASAEATLRSVKPKAPGAAIVAHP